LNGVDDPVSGFGYFNDQNEYVFTRPDTPRPMLNYMWNERILSAVNQTGGGDGALGGHAMVYVDPEDRGRCCVIRGGNRYFYIKNMETGKFFNPGWYPSKTPVENYRCTFGPGYCTLKSSFQGLRVRLTGFVGENHPCEIWMLDLKNTLEKPVPVKAFSYAEFQLDGYPAQSDYYSYVYGEYRKDVHMVFCHNNAAERPHGWYHAFIAADTEPSGFDSSRKRFLGTYGEIGCPDAVRRGKCFGSSACCEPMAGILEHCFFLPPGGTGRVKILIGSADSIETAESMAYELLFTKGKAESELESLKKSKRKTAEKISVSTPDQKVNLFTNCWLKQQIQLCAEIGRDGCKGFRDQLQDAWAMAAFRPGLSREKILEALRYEYSDGRCERGWMPVTHRIYSDAPVWISPCVNAYLKETGRADILEEEVPYLDSGSGSVLDHILRALRNSSDDTGEHGLVHALAGDWNDSLNMIGTAGKGESIWTSIGLYFALNEMAEISGEILGDDALKQEMERRAESIKAAVNRYGWDGNWYLAAYNDQMEKVGTHTEKSGRIYLNPQSWAIFSGIADGDRRKKCFRAIDTLLESPYGPLTLYPPYRSFNEQIGRLTAFVPGIWENGAPYCHGGAFKIVADCAGGRGDRAYHTLMQIFPDSESNPSDVSGCEPYALTNMYLGPSNPRAGQVQYAWITGSAGWIFRAVTQYMLGFYPGYGSVRFRPCIPSSWKTCEMTRPFRGDTYHVTIRNSRGRQYGLSELYLDGQKQKGDQIRICGDGGKHEVTVVL
jgi:cellobiose phosphorylase